MQFSRRTTIAMLAAGGALIPAPAFAHRQKISITTIEWLAEASELGVTHAIHLHDGIRALAMKDLIESPDLEDAKAKAHLALLISKQFKLHDQDGRHIHLEVLGAETEGSMIYIYQTAKMDAAPEQLRVHNTILQDVFEGQRGHVDIDLPSLKATLQFANGDGSKLAG